MINLRSCQILRNLNASEWTELNQCDAVWHRQPAKEKTTISASLFLHPSHQWRRGHYNSRAMYLKKLPHDIWGRMSVPQELQVTGNLERYRLLSCIPGFSDTYTLYQRFQTWSCSELGRVTSKQRRNQIHCWKSCAKKRILKKSHFRWKMDWYLEWQMVISVMRVNSY